MSFLGYIVLFFILRFLYNTYKGVTSGQRSAAGQSNQSARTTRPVSPQDFELSLLSLCALVIKADGQVSQRELDYVRQYFIQAYGTQRANAVFRVFNDVIKKRQVSASRICRDLTARTRYESRLEIVHFLFGIAQSDGVVGKPEVDVIRNIAEHLRVNRADFESLKAMFFKDAVSAYKILELTKQATDTEVKKAYRTMAKKYHPDKLIDMDEAYRKNAEAKFRKVQEAYEQIRKERGMV